jgi:preprotein translocase subunit YajC
MITLTSILLQTGTTTQQPGGGGMFWVMIIALFAIMYFFMIRPQRKKQKEIENFRKALHVGQDVITAGGIHGTIRQIDEATNVIVLEIAKDVKIRIDKACIYADSSSVASQQAEVK